MIEHKLHELGHVEYHEGGYWIEMPLGDEDPIMYHTCKNGHDCDILLLEETIARECYQCGKVEIPDGLWTLYALLDGRGVR